MNRFSELILALDVYKTDIDKIVAQYRKTDAENKRIYNAETFAEYHVKNAEEAKQKVQKRQMQITERVNGIIADVQDALKSWVAAPVPANMLPLFTLLLSGNVRLDGYEIEALSEKVGNSYMAQKLLADLAERSGLPMAYRKPNIQNYDEALKRVISETDFFVRGYIGTKSPLAKELLPADVNDNIIYAAAACRPLAGNSNILVASLLWDGDGPVHPLKEKLTSDDREILDKMFAGCQTPEHFASRAEEAIRINPEVEEILRLSEKYSRYVPKEGVSQIENNSEDIQ